MNIYSHRGNLEGPNFDLENHPDYIDKAISKGFKVELDLRFDQENFFLGHDYTQYKVDIKWLEERKNYILIHCKDIFSSLSLNNFHFFCHLQDDFVLTSKAMIWVHNLDLIFNSKNLIVPLMNKKLIHQYFKIDRNFSVCTDFPIYLADNYK